MLTFSGIHLFRALFFLPVNFEECVLILFSNEKQTRLGVSLYFYNRIILFVGNKQRMIFSYAIVTAGMAARVAMTTKRVVMAVS